MQMKTKGNVAAAGCETNLRQDHKCSSFSEKHLTVIKMKKQHTAASILATIEIQTAMPIIKLVFFLSSSFFCRYHR